MKNDPELRVVIWSMRWFKTVNFSSFFFQVYFEGERGGDFRGDISVDDIAFKKCTEPVQATQQPTTTQAPTTTKQPTTTQTPTTTKQPTTTQTPTSTLPPTTSSVGK